MSVYSDLNLRPAQLLIIWQVQSGSLCIDPAVNGWIVS